MKQKIGVVDVGGGFRGVYAAGVFDYCLAKGITFDIGIGVSAGSANIASFMAGQAKRNYDFYTKYGQRKQYMSIDNLIKKKSYLDLDYIYGTLSNSSGESPLNYTEIMKNPMKFLIVATNAKTGLPRYFTKDDMGPDQYNILKASSAIPAVCQPYKILNSLYYDSALSDPVPIKKAFQMGCDKVILILTLPKNTIRKYDKDILLARSIQKSYPLAARNLAFRASYYNQDVSLAHKYEKEGKVLIVAPDDTCGVSTLSRNPKDLHQLYLKGYHDGKKIKQFLHSI